MWAGRITCFLLVPLIIAMVFEVVSRKMFAVFTDYGYNELAISIGLAQPFGSMTPAECWVVSCSWPLPVMR